MGVLERRYAQALFEAARDRAGLEAVAEAARRLALLFQAPELGAALAHPRLAAASKAAVLEAALNDAGGDPTGLLDGLFAAVLRRRRGQALPGILAAFRGLVLEARGVLEGHVETARPLGPEALARLAEGLASRLGASEVRLEERVRPELLAGARVVVAGRLFDSTAFGRLQELRRRLLAAPLERRSDVHPWST